MNRAKLIANGIELTNKVFDKSLLLTEKYLEFMNYPQEENEEHDPMIIFNKQINNAVNLITKGNVYEM